MSQKLLVDLKGQLFLRFAYLYARCMRILYFRRGAKKSILILPPWSPASLGDEAMERAVLDYSRRQGINRIVFVSYKAQDDWSHLQVVNETLNMESYFLAGCLRHLVIFIQKVVVFDRFLILGADVLGGTYSIYGSLNRLWLANVAARAGVNTSIITFSLKQDLPQEIVKAFHDLPNSVNICVRDPESYKRLSRYLSRPITQAADIAFLLVAADPLALDQKVLKWIQLQRSLNRSLVGLNINYHLIDLFDDITAADLIQAYRSLLLDLSQDSNSPSFLIIPHDYCSGMNDLTLAQKLLETLPPSIQLYCRIFPRDPAPAVKTVCGMIDVMLTGRMHLAVACLGQQTPVASIAYEQKFEGLYQLFNLCGLTITPQEAIISGKLSEFFIPIYHHRNTVALQIAAKLPAVKNLSKANLSSIQSMSG